MWEEGKFGFTSGLQPIFAYSTDSEIDDIVQTEHFVSESFSWATVYILYGYTYIWHIFRYTYVYSVYGIQI